MPDDSSERRQLPACSPPGLWSLPTAVGILEEAKQGEVLDMGRGPGTGGGGQVAKIQKCPDPGIMTKRLAPTKPQSSAPWVPYRNSCGFSETEGPADPRFTSGTVWLW